MRSRQTGHRRADDLRRDAREQIDGLISALDQPATFEVDAPDDPSGEWLIDLRIDLFEISIAWRAEQGFGIFTSGDANYGARPDEVYRDPQLAANRLAQLADQWRREGTVHAIALGDVRRLVQVSQTTIAEKLGVGQAVISRLENRQDARIGTVIDYVRALGGELRLVAEFDGFEVPVELAPRRGLSEALTSVQRATQNHAHSAVAALQDVGRKATILVEHWTGSLAKWASLKPAAGVPLSQGATGQPLFVGGEIPLDGVVSDDLLQTDLSWAEGPLQLMISYDEKEHIRSIHAALVKTHYDRIGYGILIVEVADQNGATIKLEITNGRPSAVVMQPGLVPDWRDLSIRLLTERAG